VQSLKQISSKDVLDYLRDLLVFSLTLPWLVLVSFWLFISIISGIISTEPAIRLGERLAGDFSSTFSFVGAWTAITVIFFASLWINFHFFRNNRTHFVVSLAVVCFLFVTYLFLLWPELDIFLKLHNVS
jgi:hypothetical protein